MPAAGEPVYVPGEVQAAQGRASSLRWKVDPASEERKRSTARRAAIVPDGPAVRP